MSYRSRLGTRRWSWKVATISGIDIRIDFTFTLVLIWVLFQVGGGDDMLSESLFAVASVLLLFLCVLLHELGHSLVAQVFGIKVRDITLLPIGGLARIEKMPEKPWHELLIALAGPAVNVVIAVGVAPVLFLALLWRGSDVSTLPEVARSLITGDGLLDILIFLGAANLSLAIFNLLPAFPMDGGRVLRSLLAMLLPYHKATRIAARVGQGLALLAAPMALLTGRYLLLVISFFVFVGASVEDRTAQMLARLTEMPVRNLLRLGPMLALAPGDTLTYALGISLENRQDNFPVANDRKLVGILTREEIIHAIRDNGGTALVGDVMRRDFPFIGIHDTIQRAYDLILRSGSVILPVFDGGRFMGFVTRDDVERARMEAM